MAFTYDLSTDRGKLRLRISDTSSTAYVFEDAELDVFLSDGGSVKGGAVEAYQSLLANAALRTKYFQLQGVSYDDRHQADHLYNLIGLNGGFIATASTGGPANHPMDDAFELTS